MLPLARKIASWATAVRPRTARDHPTARARPAERCRRVDQPVGVAVPSRSPTFPQITIPMRVGAEMRMRMGRCRTVAVKLSAEPLVCRGVADH